MKIGYAILLEEESHNYARMVELDLCKKFGFTMGLKQSPHITVKSPFEIDDIDPFLDYADKIAIETTTFDIEIKGINYFEPNVAYLDIVKNCHLSDMHFKFVQELQENYSIQPDELEGEKMVFHSTLALKDINEKNFTEVKKFMNNYNPHFQFTAKRLGVFYNLGDAGWIVVKIVKLNTIS